MHPQGVFGPFFDNFRIWRLGKNASLSKIAMPMPMHCVSQNLLLLWCEKNCEKCEDHFGGPNGELNCGKARQIQSRMKMISQSTSNSEGFARNLCHQLHCWSGKHGMNSEHKINPHILHNFFHTITIPYYGSHTVHTWVWYFW